MSNFAIDVVIPVHGQWPWLSVCLAALEAFTTMQVRVILVDNASPDEQTRGEVKRLNRVIVRNGKVHYKSIMLNENHSFSRAINVGVRAGDAPHIFILNTDAIVQPGWCEQIVSDLAHEQVGLSGFSSNYASGLQGNPAAAKLYDPKFLVFLAVALRRDVWKKVGCMDDKTFDGFSCEDIDYSFRVVDKGYDLIVSDGYVHHGGSQTIAATVGGSDAQKNYNARFQARLVEKHGEERVLESMKPQSPNILLASMSPTDMTHIPYVEGLMNLRMRDLAGLGAKLSYVHPRRALVHAMRQGISEYAVANGYDYLCMIDDDQVVPPDTLTRLFSHDKDVVGALAYTRKAPFTTCVFKWSDKLGKKLERGSTFRWGLNMEGIEHTGLRKVDCIGFSCVLIKVAALKKISAWLEKNKRKSDDTAGLQRKADKSDVRFNDNTFFGHFQNVGEDFYFCALAGAAGVDVYCDTDLIVDHLGDAIVVNEAHAKAYRSAAK